MIYPTLRLPEKSFTQPISLHFRHKAHIMSGPLVTYRHQGHKSRRGVLGGLQLPKLGRNPFQSGNFSERTM